MAVIVGGVVLATTIVARSGGGWDQRFRSYRQGVGRSILLGLERHLEAGPVECAAGVVEILVLLDDLRLRAPGPLLDRGALLRGGDEGLAAAPSDV